ncbi:hypothetical protein EsDP_00004306 [Epichloe bromicola]|uniref:S-adenosyl-L-methionine-dependent methyltransferase n=1 Tax=Epichloe bromicola TaxID=79588 RepID=A0ABQ0CRB4_9HYPO
MPKDQECQNLGRNFAPDADVTREKESSPSSEGTLADGAHANWRVRSGAEDQKEERAAYRASLQSEEVDLLTQEEQDRLDFQHEIYLFTMNGRLGRAPVREPRNVLDVATGTGIWAVRTQPPTRPATSSGRTSRRCNAPGRRPTSPSSGTTSKRTPGLPGPQLDYLHLRFTICCFDSTPSVIRRAFEHLAPGGWIEFYDPSVSYFAVDQPLEGAAIRKWASLVNEGGLRVGRDMSKARRYVEWLRDAGFVNVAEERLILPCNAWEKDERMKEFGGMMLRNELALVGCLGKFLRLAVEEEEEARAVEEAARNLRDSSLRLCKYMYIVYAQKPLAA